MKLIKEVFKYWLPVLFWAGLIFYLSSVPNLKTAPDPVWDNLFRNFSHLIFYFIFSLLWIRGLRLMPRPQKYFWALLLVFFYSLSDEIHQSFVPTRNFQVLDLVIDNLGSVLAVFLIVRFLPRLPIIIRNWFRKLELT
jgi:VanZ family protein